MLRDNLLQKFEKPIPSLKELIEDALDINFNISEIRINSYDHFERELLRPYSEGADIYYRGERIYSADRRLIPTYLRKLTKEVNELGLNELSLNSKTLLEYYQSRENFMNVYSLLYNEARIDNLYDMTAFAQHYLGVSPFIDFSKNLFASLSFALKGRKSFDDDFVIFTAFDIGEDDTTSDINEVNHWLKDYNVKVVNFERTIQKKHEKNLKNLGVKPLSEIRRDFKEIQEFPMTVSPTAKLIDIPTNDLMKYQQGVFLLLNGFTLIDSNYLTKSLRQSFEFKKFIINKDLGIELGALLEEKAPQYRYEAIMDIKKAVSD